MAADYEIRIKGRVGDSVLRTFEGLTATTEPVETVLSGPIPDQEALHLLLVARNFERIADHAPNIGEDVIYYVEGRDIRHPQAKAAAG